MIEKLHAPQEVPLGCDSEKFDIRGMVFFSGPQLYIWYVEVLRKTHNEGDRTFYDAIRIDSWPITLFLFYHAGIHRFSGHDQTAI